MRLFRRRRWRRRRQEATGEVWTPSKMIRRLGLGPSAYLDSLL
jgi:hypothetical protein